MSQALHELLAVDVFEVEVANAFERNGGDEQAIARTLEGDGNQVEHRLANGEGAADRGGRDGFEPPPCRSDDLGG